MITKVKEEAKRPTEEGSEAEAIWMEKPSVERIQATRSGIVYLCFWVTDFAIRGVNILW